MTDGESRSGTAKVWSSERGSDRDELAESDSSSSGGATMDLSTTT